MHEVVEKIKNSLQTRRIPCNVYEFTNYSIVVISIVRGRKMSINLAHQIIKNPDGTFTVSDFEDKYVLQNSSFAINRIISLIRRAEITFSKYTKK